MGSFSRGHVQGEFCVQVVSGYIVQYKNGEKQIVR